MKSLRTLMMMTLVISTTLGCSKSKPQPSQATSASAQSAIDSAQAAVAQAPNFDNWTALGLAFSNAGRSEEALTAFKRSSEINPKSAIALNNICSVHNMLRQWDSAVTTCKRALELDPALDRAKNNLNIATRSKAASDARMVALRKDIQEGKDADQNRLSLGLEHYFRENYDQAVKIWEQVPATSKDYANALNNLATAYIKLQKLDRAREAINTALKLEPNNQLFQNNARWLADVSAKPR